MRESASTVFTKGVREDKIKTVRQNYKQKKHRRGTQERYFLLLNVVHASFTRGTVERKVVLPSRLPAPSRLALFGLPTVCVS